jgi:hypothetical protein
VTIIEKALERLDGPGALVWMDNGVSSAGPPALPLAALIRVTAKPWYSENRSWCRACQRRVPDHAPDCALIQLCEAVVGEKA